MNQFLLHMIEWSAFITCAHLELLQALALVPSWARSIVLFLASACDFQHWLVFASFSIHAVFHSSICCKVNSKSSKDFLWFLSLSRSSQHEKLTKRRELFRGKKNNILSFDYSDCKCLATWGSHIHAKVNFLLNTILIHVSLGVMI